MISCSIMFSWSSGSSCFPWCPLGRRQNLFSYLFSASLAPATSSSSGVQLYPLTTFDIPMDIANFLCSPNEEGGEGIGRVAARDGKGESTAPSEKKNKSQWVIGFGGGGCGWLRSVSSKAPTRNFPNSGLPTRSNKSVVCVCFMGQYPINMLILEGIRFHSQRFPSRKFLFHRFAASFPDSLFYSTI